MSVTLRAKLLRKFDRLYLWDLRFRLRFTPLGRAMFWSMWLSAVIGVNTSINLASQTFVLIAILFAVAITHTLLKRRSRYHLKVERFLPEYSFEQTQLSYQLTIKNLSQHPLHNIRCFEQIQFHFPTEAQFQQFYDEDDVLRNRFDRWVGYPKWRKLVDLLIGVRFEAATPVQLQPHQQVQYMQQVQFIRRGNIQFHQVYVLDADVLGLINKIIPITVPQSFLVLPRLYPVRMPHLSSQRIFQPDGNQSARAVADNEEFYGLRDYIPGDPVKNIHWKSWAKIQKPVVKQFRPEYLVRHAIILDTAIPGRYHRCFEAALSVTSSFIMAANTQESLLDVVYIGERLYQLSTGFGLDRRRELLKALACTEPSDAIAFSQLQQVVLQQYRNLSSMIIVLSYWDDERANFVHQLEKCSGNFLVLLLTMDEKVTIEQPVTILPIPTLAEKLLEL